MQKELNPDLFGQSSVSKTRMVESNDPSAPGLGFQQAMQMEQRMVEFRNQINSMIEQMNRMVTQVNEFMRTTQGQIGELNSAIGQLQANDQALAIDNTQKLTQLNQKLGERKSLDGKTQEMIDRHNSVLKSYELRLSQLQKLIAEREQQIVSAQGMLNDTKLELIRLKRL